MIFLINLFKARDSYKNNSYKSEKVKCAKIEKLDDRRFIETLKPCVQKHAKTSSIFQAPNFQQR